MIVSRDAPLRMAPKSPFDITVGLGTLGYGHIVRLGRDGIIAPRFGGIAENAAVGQPRFAEAIKQDMAVVIR